MKFSKDELFTEFNWIMKEIGFPDILLVNSREFKDIANESVSWSSCGKCCISKRVIWINANQTNHLELRDTIWHEILHLCFPFSTEWWIECCAYKLSRNNAESFGCYADMKSKTPKDVPSRKLLIEMIFAALEDLR